MKSGEHPKTPRDCVVCKKPIPERPYQLASVRTCGPVCAHDLAHKEHPDLRRWDSEPSRP